MKKIKFDIVQSKNLGTGETTDIPAIAGNHTSISDVPPGGVKIDNGTVSRTVAHISAIDGIVLQGGEFEQTGGVPRDADTLGGHSTEYFAVADNVELSETEIIPHVMLKFNKYFVTLYTTTNVATATLTTLVLPAEVRPHYPIQGAANYRSSSWTSSSGYIVINPDGSIGAPSGTDYQYINVCMTWAI